MALGTAPRRIRAGIWKTRSGQTLTPAQATIWEGYFRSGHTDGRGHFRKTVSVVQAPPKPQVGPTTNRVQAKQDWPYWEKDSGGVKAPRQGMASTHQGPAHAGWRMAPPAPPTPKERRQAQQYAAVQKGKAEVDYRTNQELFGGAYGSVLAANKTINPLVGDVLTGLGNIAPHILKAAAGGNLSIPGIVADVAFMLPGGRITKAVGGAVRAGEEAAVLRRTEAAARAAATREGKLFTPRTLSVGDVTQQIPGKASSRITRPIENLADWVSTAMMGEGKVARTARWFESIPVLPNPSAEARVARHAGRQRVFESGLTRAAAEKHLAALPDEHSASDIAHSWWAQLPASHRNMETLVRIHDRWVDELIGVETGDRVAGLTRKLELAKAGQARLATAHEAAMASKNTQEINRSLARVKYNDNRIENLQVQIADQQPGGRLSEDLQLAMAKLDKAITANPTLDPKVIEAIHYLSNDRKSILTAAGHLDPAKAAQREGLVTRELGLAPPLPAELLKPPPGLIAQRERTAQLQRLVDRAGVQVGKQRYTSYQLKQIGGVLVDPETEVNLQTRLDAVNKQINALRHKPQNTDEIKALREQRRQLNVTIRFAGGLSGLQHEFQQAAEALLADAERGTPRVAQAAGGGERGVVRPQDVPASHPGMDSITYLRNRLHSLDAEKAADEHYTQVFTTGNRDVKWTKYPTKRAAVVAHLDELEAKVRTRIAREMNAERAASVPAQAGRAVAEARVPISAGVSGMAEQLILRSEALTEELKRLGGIEKMANIPKEIADEAAALRRDLKRFRANRPSVQQGGRIITGKGGVMEPVGYQRQQRLLAALSVQRDKQAAAEQAHATRQAAATAAHQAGQPVLVQDTTKLGLTGADTPAYLGHRLAGEQVRRASPDLHPASYGFGKASTPQGLGKNNGVLLRQGRLEQSTHVAARDWMAAHVHRNAVADRLFLFQLGRPYKAAERIAKGDVLINPYGASVPKQFKVDAFAALMENGTDKEIEKQAEGILGGYAHFVDESPGQTDEVIQQWADQAGVSKAELESKLRVVNESTAKRYYGQFGRQSPSKIGGRAYDTAVNYMGASLIFARLGYVPKNWLQNAVMTVPHQGIFSLVNVPRGFQALADPELGHYMQFAAGGGATEALATEAGYGLQAVRRGAERAPGRLAHWQTQIADLPLRASAVIHEFAKEGLISKYSASLSDADRATMLRYFSAEPGSNDFARLQTIIDRAHNAMADFTRLTPEQRKWARRFLIIPGWLWAGSRYPVHFAATHPLRSAALAYAAAGEPYADRLGLPQNRPINELFAKGLPSGVQGIATPWGVFRTQSLSPVNTPFDLAMAAAGRSTQTLGEYTNPLGMGIIDTLYQEVRSAKGPYKVGLQQAIIRNLERLVPDYKFVRSMVSPGATPSYPGDKTIWGRLLRELGVVPIPIAGADTGGGGSIGGAFDVGGDSNVFDTGQGGGSGAFDIP